MIPPRTFLPVGIPHIFLPIITRHALIQRIGQVGPDIAGRHHGLHNLQPGPTARHRERRFTLAIRELVLHAQIHEVPGADLHVRDALRVPQAGRRGEGRAGRVTLRGARRVGAELAVHEE